MSLLTNPPHVVEVQVRERVDSARGKSEYRPIGPPVAVRCSFQGAREWATEEEITTKGLQVLSLARIFAATWPGDVNALVTFRGEVFETVGDPVHHQMSRLTNHWAITVRKIARRP